MPWRCTKCSTDVNEDDLACPSCAAPKTSWTMVVDKTRTFRVTGRKVSTLRGVGSGPLPTPDPAGELVPAQAAVAIPKRAALALAELAWAPAPRDVLTVRLHPRRHTDWTIGLTVELETDEAEELTFPLEASPEFPGGSATHDVRFLFVFGPEETSDLTLPGVDHVVDVGEDLDGAWTCAPELELVALRKPPKQLPLSEQRLYLINHRFFDRRGRVPLRGEACRLGGRAGKTDEDGFLRIEYVAAGRHEIEFAPGEAEVQASHDPDCVIFARVPGYAASDEDLDAHPRRVRALEPEQAEGAAAPGAAGPPAWLPTLDEADDPEPSEEPEDAQEIPEEEYDALHADVEGDDEPKARYLLNARVFDRTGRVPVAEAECKVRGASYATDRNGLLRVDDVPAGRHVVSFASGEVEVPASHHPECVLRVRLLSHEADAEALAARPRGVRALEASSEDGAPPAWLALSPDDPGDDAGEPEEDADEQLGDDYDLLHADVDELSSLLE